MDTQRYGSTKVTFSGQLTTDIGRLDQLKFINRNDETERRERTKKRAKGLLGDY